MDQNRASSREPLLTPDSREGGRGETWAGTLYALDAFLYPAEQGFKESFKAYYTGYGAGLVSFTFLGNYIL